MKLSAAMEEVNNMYVPGAIDFYARMKNDPWQKANDDFEASLLTKDETIMQAAADVWVSRMRTLIKKYQEFTEGEKPPEPEPFEHMFVKAKPEINTNAWCWSCGDTQNLFIEFEPGDKTKTRFACTRHKIRH